MFHASTLVPRYSMFNGLNPVRKALAENSQMSTHISGFQSFFRFLHHFCNGHIGHKQY